VVVVVVVVVVVLDFDESIFIVVSGAGAGAAAGAAAAGAASCVFSLHAVIASTAATSAMRFMMCSPCESWSGTVETAPCTQSSDSD
jgi:hypothetical protein